MSRARKKKKTKKTRAKVLVVGDAATGKTSFIQRAAHGDYEDTYATTVGVDFSLTERRVNGGGKVQVALWDVAGQERFIGMARVFYRDAVAAFVTFDVGDRRTFASVQRWKEDISAKVFLPNGDPIPVYLLGNKCDLPADARQVTNQQAARQAKALDFAGYVETSAKANVNVNEAVDLIAQRIADDAKKIAVFQAAAGARGGAGDGKGASSGGARQGGNVKLGSEARGRAAGGGAAKKKDGCCS